MQETGYRKALARISLEDREEIVLILRQFYTLVRVKPELDQFIDGLKTLELLDMVREHPQLLRPLFVAGTPVQLSKGK